MGSDLRDEKNKTKQNKTKKEKNKRGQSMNRIRLAFFFRGLYDRDKTSSFLMTLDLHFQPTFVLELNNNLDLICYLEHKE